ncbi:hypothetical protein ABEB36_008407 [Hypothenemus hampei]|uniref:UDP-glucuronosyltransferase n=1 Tax=Hypothenemus hampei TaxID=57062 RepID=A0ABD1ELR9_HYPHA
MNYIQSIIIIVAVFNKFSEAARLLGVFPMPAGSHNILANKLMVGFAKAGHHVTMISSHKTKNIPANASWDDIVLDGVADRFEITLRNINMFEDSNRSMLHKLKSYQYLMTDWLNTTLYHPKVRALLTKDTKFDAVVMEQFLNDAHKYFAHYFQCPLILLSSTGANPWVNRIIMNPEQPSYVPYFLYEGDFNFKSLWDRFYNLFLYIQQYFLDIYFTDPFQNELLQSAFPDAPHIEELNKRITIILLNSHETLLDATPLVPNMVNIGGYHIDPPKKLPNKLQSYLDNNKQGVVYFSLGSNVKSKDMPIEKRQVFINVFKKLKQNVLWKFEDENITDLPENVLIQKWMPQQDILAHPNIKLFITHGGLLSTTETIYHGVPILAIPVFADQFRNAKKAVEDGYGLILPYNDPNFNEKSLLHLINELLYFSNFTDNVKRKSKLFHDRPLRPMETAVFWLEYVLRNNGVEYLQVAGTKLPLYQFLLLDIIGIVLVSVISFYYIVSKSLHILFLRKKNRSKQKIN